MRTSAEVEAEVEASRSDLDRNVEALKQKMTPGQLFDEASRMMGGTGQQVASKFAEQAKANPMPLAVMGLGLAWLMMSNNRSSHGTSQSGGMYGLSEQRSFGSTPFEEATYEGSESGGTSLGERASGVAEGLKDKAHSLGEKAQGVLSGAKEKLAGARASAADTGRSAGHGLSSAGGAVRQKATQVGQQAQRTFMETLESEPMLLAGLGIAVGAAIGAALPRTEAENRVLGETRDRLFDKGKDLAHTGMEKAGAAAQATYGAVKSELKNGDDDREPAERLADAARSGVQAAQEQLQGPAH